MLHDGGCSPVSSMGSHKEVEDIAPWGAFPDGVSSQHSWQVVLWHSREVPLWQRSGSEPEPELEASHTGATVLPKPWENCSLCPLSGDSSLRSFGELSLHGG